MKLINKDAVVAMINKIFDEDYDYLPSDIFEYVEDFKYDLLEALDTLEKKEADIEYVRKDVFNEKAIGWIDYNN